MATPETSSESSTPARKTPARKSGSATKKTTSAKTATGSADTTPPRTPSKSSTSRKPATSATKATTAKSSPAKANTAKVAKTVQSRDSSTTAKEHAEHVDRIWELAKRIGICMFVTWDGERQRARPLAAAVEKDEGAVYFLTDMAGEKDDQIDNFPIVTLAFADHAHSKYVSITGKATVSNDRARIKQIWSPFAKAWWDSPEDPNIRVVKVMPQDAELWDSPGRIVSTISMLAAAVTRRSPKLGENAKVAF